MKNLHLLLLVATLMLPVAIATAAPVTLEQAMITAEAHAMQCAPRRAPGAVVTITPPSLAAAARNASGAVDYYVFNTHAGFVIVAGDDRCVPVLGYSDRGEFDPDNVPAGLQYMLDNYAAQVAYLHANPDVAPAAAPQVLNTEVKPLLKSNWGQNEPFNRLCPDLDNETKCATGCVATAAAQIMYYHKHPTSGEKAYNWDLMLPNYMEGSYTDEQAEAVAQLMSDLGKSAGMVYGKTSTASHFRMMTAMRDEYGYNKAMRCEIRSTKTYTEWENMLTTELDAKRPVLYIGFTDKGGHAFVVDGYNKQGYFHVNWGWDALSNGYFLLADLSPKAQGTGSFYGGYNGCQGMVCGICPDNGASEPENYLQVSVDNFQPINNKKEVELGQPITFEFNNLTAAGHGYGFGVDVTLAYVLTDVSNNNPKVISYEANYSVSFGSRNSQGNNRFDVTPGTDLAPGEYHLHLMYKCPQAGINDYRPYDHSADVQGYLVARVQDGKMTFERPNASHKGLRVTRFDLPETVVDHDFVIVPLTLVNDGEEYSDNIIVAIKSENETEFDDRFVQPVSLPKGREITLDLDLSLPRPVGTHYIMLRDVNGRVLDGPRKLVTEAASTYTLVPASQLTVVNGTAVSGTVKATIDVKNSGDKDFKGGVYFRIRHGNKTWATGMTSPVSIAAGETTTVNISMPFEGQPGAEYTLEVYSLTAQTTAEQALCQATFNISATTAVEDLATAGVDINVNGDVLTVSGSKTVSVYSITGAKVGPSSHMRLPAGIYIVVADGVTRKIRIN